MSAITRQYRTYTYSDEELGIEIIFGQVDNHRYDLSAHIQVWAMNNQEEWVRLFRARNGITSTHAHKTISDAVETQLFGNEKKGKAGLVSHFGLTSPIVTSDWFSVINKACEDVREAFNKPNPPVNLYDEEAEDDDVWRIPALLSEDINVIYGQSGSGKSYLAAICGQAIHHGVPFCGLRTIKGNVLLVDYETTGSKIRRRLKRIDVGLNVDGTPMLYIPASVPLVNQLESLQAYVLEHDISFLIIDSLARACGGKITDEDSVGSMFESLRQIGLPCLIIHHTNRSDEYYGSPFIKAYSRNLWRLRSVQNQDLEKQEGRLSIKLQQEKENDGPNLGDLGFVLTFEGDPYDPQAVRLVPQDASLVPELRKTLHLWEQIKVHLEETDNHRMLIDDPNPNTTYTMVGGNIVRELGVAKSQHETLRNYIWALKHNTTDRYKQLRKYMHIDADWICLNSDLGNANNHAPSEDVARDTIDTMEIIA